MGKAEDLTAESRDGHAEEGGVWRESRREASILPEGTPEVLPFDLLPSPFELKNGANHSLTTVTEILL